LRTFSRLLAGILLAIAIFIIFNCAGYLLVTIVGSTVPLDTSAATNPGATVSTQAAVVAFSTPTATAGTTLSISTPQLSVQALASATPLPLLPTVNIAALSTPTPPAQPTDRPTRSTQAYGRATAEAIATSQLQVLSHRSYVDSLGWHHIVGEVQNNSSIPMEFVEVIARLYDEGENVIGTKLTFTAPDVIFPGGKASFDIIALRRSQWDRIKEYRLAVKGDVSDSLVQENLVVLNQQSYIEDGYLHVAGEVENTGESPLLVKLIVTLYDANYQVVNTNWGYADVGVLSPDEISSFSVKVTHQTDPNNFHYRIQVEEEQVETN
jgi:hypothetical protein